MKKLLFSIGLSFLLLAGCSDIGTNSDFPESPNSQGAKKEIVKIPSRSSLGIEAQFTAVETIDGQVGGSVVLNATYPSGSGSVSISAVLTVPAGAFQGTKDISVTFEDALAAVELLPSMQFDVPLSLDLSYGGIDLSSVSANSVDFAYIAGENQFQPVQKENLKVDAATGNLSVNKAVLTHFSRYAFIK